MRSEVVENQSSRDGRSLSSRLPLPMAHADPAFDACIAITQLTPKRKEAVNV